MPAALYKTIAREAQALADGDRAAFDQIVDIQNYNHYQALLDNLEAWGQPTDAALYSILDFRLTATDKAWVEVKQFRVDRFVQEIRFYHLRNGEWRRTDFDPSFWSGRTETSETPHFRFTYFIEDYELIEPLASLLEGDYEQICTDFDCPLAPMACVEGLGKQWCSSFPREVEFRLSLNAPIEQEQFHIAENGDLIFTLPSLRQLDQLSFIDRQSDLRNPIAWLHIMRLAYGRVDLQGPPPHGRALVIAAFFREYDRLRQRTGSEPLEMPEEFKNLDTANLPSLDSMWSEVDTADADQMYAVAYAVIEYVEQEFGWPAVVKLLKAIGPSKSFADAIETSTGISYVAFEEHWRAWVTVNASTTP